MWNHLLVRQLEDTLKTSRLLRRRFLRFPPTRISSKSWSILVINTQLWVNKILNRLSFLNIYNRVQAWKAPKELWETRNRILELSTHLSTRLQYPSKHGMKSQSWKKMASQALNPPNFKQFTASLSTMVDSHRSRRTRNKVIASIRFQILALVQVSKCNSKWWTKQFSN